MAMFSVKSDCALRFSANDSHLHPTRSPTRQTSGEPSRSATPPPATRDRLLTVPTARIRRKSAPSPAKSSLNASPSAKFDHKEMSSGFQRSSVSENGTPQKTLRPKSAGNRRAISLGSPISQPILNSPDVPTEATKTLISSSKGSNSNKDDGCEEEPWDDDLNASPWGEPPMSSNAGRIETPVSKRPRTSPRSSKSWDSERAETPSSQRKKRTRKSNEPPKVVEVETPKRILRSTSKKSPSNRYNRDLMAAAGRVQDECPGEIPTESASSGTLMDESDDFSDAEMFDTPSRPKTERSSKAGSKRSTLKRALADQMARPATDPGPLTAAEETEEEPLGAYSIGNFMPEEAEEEPPRACSIGYNMPDRQAEEPRGSSDVKAETPNRPKLRSSPRSRGKSSSSNQLRVGPLTRTTSSPGPQTPGRKDRGTDYLPFYDKHKDGALDYRAVINTAYYNMTSKKAASSSKPGYIYLYTHKDYPGYVKIGKETIPDTRTGQQAKSCKEEFTEVNIGSKVATPRFALVEKLIHWELDGCNQRYECFKHESGKSGNQGKILHKEWFKIETEDAVKCVNRWRNWMANTPCPFTDYGLTRKWQRALKITEDDWRSGEDRDEFWTRKLDPKNIPDVPYSWITDQMLDTYDWIRNLNTSYLWFRLLAPGCFCIGLVYLINLLSAKQVGWATICILGPWLLAFTIDFRYWIQKVAS
ncbi:MAG: hypothetical protein M1819_000433 [Sarea resinae]|nr:MAG: hypothetical protein M1819_000433 [Sarea resinae]